MKAKFLNMTIATIISALFAYGFYAFCVTAEYALLLAIGGFISMLVPVAVAVGMAFDFPRTGVMARTLSAVFALVAFISHVLFTMVYFTVPLYIIVNGIILLVFLLILNSIIKTKQ